VAWTNQRTDGLAVLFTLGALLAILRDTLPVPRLPAVLALSAFALGSKEVAATLPVTAALCVWAARGRPGLRDRRPSLAAVAALVAAYAVFWTALFPAKVAGIGGGWEGMEASRGLAAWLGPPLALFALVFAPVLDYEAWRGMAVADVRAIHLVAGVLIPVLATLALRRLGEAGPARVALLGLAWPVVTVGPLLAIPEVDLFRLGLMVALAFGLVWAAALTAVERRWAAIAVALAVLAAASLTVPARRTAAAWGPRGSMKAELPLWRRHVGDRWWNALTPEMQRRFEEEVSRQGHERRLMEEE
jgi:hypothetical protein